MLSHQRHRFVVTSGDAGLRLDQLLASRIEGLSRRKARVLLDIGGVYVDGARVKSAGRKLKPGQVVEAVLGSAIERATGKPGKDARERDLAMLPPIDIVFEDDDVVVVDKPPGVLAAPTPEGDRGNVADQLGRRGHETARVFVVHRIDLPTSGLLVYAKTGDANAMLSSAFSDHDIERCYDAVVWGRWPLELTTIGSPVAGKRAVSHFAIAESRESSTRLSVTLETGRTHQIRIHCAGAGHPILGDRTHGDGQSAPRMGGRLALHARVLGFKHPRTGEAMRFESETPIELA